MNLNIGAIIKQLRMENNITQDTLSAALGVSPQAISRWESGNGYPDIELLPMLADFFSVSTDELLGYRLSEREENLLGIKKEMERLSEVGTDDEQLAFARSAFSRYPNDPEIRVYLAACLADRWEETREPSLLTEAETLCTAVIETCHDEDTRYEAITALSCIYSKTDRIEKAKETLQMLSPMKYCRESALACGIGDGNTEWYIQDEIHKLTDCLGTALRALAVSEEVPNDPSAWEKKIEMLTVSNRLYEMIYGENLMFYHCRLSRNFWLISTYQLSLGRPEDALSSLENMCAHAVAYDLSYRNNHGKSYTSIFTDKLIYPEPGKNSHELTEHTECYHLIERLQSHRYDGIRDHERFRAVIAALEEYAE